ncbi:hypothetical protein BDN71DRAFT_1466204 [Pleurotus eryngii]|uniref:DUF6589 domain-containing protein n=1 Tax=Pleurotus eryngii TaxID=5323 RepID=A0A9P6A1D4_PLEER|nr:hypothetical protein BDN71DRAFT_1466204 [Pleurotus eryngii]
MTQTKQVPNRTLDVAPSTPAQNAEAIEGFLAQAALGDPTETPGVTDVDNQIVLISGDLLTGERIRSLLVSRSEEATPWRRLQFVVYVMGLFHLKMACTDAIWRIFIQPKAVRGDTTCLMDLFYEIRPRETGKLGSKPGYRRMHECIEHIGIVLRLDAWRLEVVKQDSSCTSLDDFASKEPTWEQTVALATTLCRERVAPIDIETSMRKKESAERDGQYENILILHQYFLLYEELSYAMNAGDIGRVEACFLPWMMIFSGCGKHKYAAELQHYLEDVHFNFPVDLRNAIRMNILCNPTGKPGKFRGIDWLVEHNNLYIKRIYCGKFSNHTKGHIINESPLIEVYKDTRAQFERMFCLDHKTTWHSPPKMTQTFKHLATYMEKERVNEFATGRTTKYTIPDMIGKGSTILAAKRGQLETRGEELDMDDLGELELEDDGGIDL